MKQIPNRRVGRGRRRRVRRFLQPCLLLLLRCGDAHGYGLVSELDRFGFNPDQLDPSLVYRALRGMEENGWIASRWDDESQGPRRRVYSLSDEGETQLMGWIEDLRRAKAEIEDLLQMYHEVAPDSEVG
jgi:PadR family transcriptional regulator PadR